MKRGGRIKTDPVKAAERAQRRAERRASEPPRAEDLAREARRTARETVRSPGAQLERKPTTPKRRRPISEASPDQRIAVALQPCLVDASHEGKTQPAHLIPRGMLTVGQEDRRAVVPLCPFCHRAYDDGTLSLLEHLEPRFRVELAFAVERFGLVSTLKRVTNDRYAAIRPGESVQSSANREREDL